MSDKKIAIFTNFTDYLSSFSPIIIVGQQIDQLVNHGYRPVVIVSDGFIPPADSAFAKANLQYIPNISDRSDDSRQDPEFESDIDAVAEHLQAILEKEKIDVVITHDLLYLPDYTKYNIAARAVADKMPKLRWLHWIHSCTSTGTLQRERVFFGDKYAQYAGLSFPNSFLVYPNSYDAARVARNLGFEESEVKVVPHAHDIAAYNKFDEITKKFVEKYDLYSADIISVYPLRMDRGKQPHYVMEIMAEVKRLGFTVRCIFVDFHSTGGDKVDYRDEIKTNSAKVGLGSDDVIFTSEFDESINTEAPRGMVADLMQLATVGIFPSRSETYSLVAQEAMASGALVILNQDFPPLYSVYGDHALYYKFSSEYDISADRYQQVNGNSETSYSPSRMVYFSGIAKRIAYEIENNRILSGKKFIRQQRNPHFVFKRFMEPLFYA
jgi:hypothetical protein